MAGQTRALAGSSAPARLKGGPFHSVWPFSELQDNTVLSLEKARLRGKLCQMAEGLTQPQGLPLWGQIKV